MISFWTERHNSGCFSKKTPLSFFADLFRRKKTIHAKKKPYHKEERKRAAMDSKMSVSVMDMRIVSPMPLSPALSLMTLTPGRTRDIDHDMEALRLSRQDNPFLRILASRESLLDAEISNDSSLDCANLMLQLDENDVDPFSLPEIHEHMIRSPPPTTWPKSPNFKIFKFPEAIPEDLPEDINKTKVTVATVQGAFFKTDSHHTVELSPAE